MAARAELEALVRGDAVLSAFENTGGSNSNNNSSSSNSNDASDMISTNTSNNNNVSSGGDGDGDKVMKRPRLVTKTAGGETTELETKVKEEAEESIHEAHLNAHDDSSALDGGEGGARGGDDGGDDDGVGTARSGASSTAPDDARNNHDDGDGDNHDDEVGGGRNAATVHGYPHSKVSYFNIVDCPVFHPSVEEFSNPLKYIAAIRHEAEKFGICVIRPPDVWQPPCVLDERDFYFSTRSERTHQLFRRRNARSLFLDALRAHLHTEGIALDPWPMLAQVEVDLYRLYHIVLRFGGAQVITDSHAWGDVAERLGIPRFSTRPTAMFTLYTKYLLSYSMLSDAERARLEREVRLNRSHPSHCDEPFGFGSGMQHSLASFKRMDQAWRRRVYGAEFATALPPEAEIEKKYWETVTGEEHFNTFYGSDIDTTVHGSAFPTSPKEVYSRFGFNLNVLPGVPESMLKYLDGISGISMPWLYVGMLFSSFCWHVEDNFLYSINYMHFGDGKRWYGVPSSHAHKLEAAFQKHLPNEFRNNPSLMHDLVTQVPPDVLAAEGVLISTCVQKPRDYVVTFPQAYHAGFSQGFNCCEAVNFAAADWLPFGMRAMQQYQLEKRPTTLDQEKLLCQVALQETDRDMLRYAFPLVKQIIAKELRIRRSRLAQLPLRTLSEAIRTNAEVFDVQDPSSSSSSMRTQKHAMQTIETMATRMRMARGLGKSTAEDVRGAALENMCMACGSCRRICFLSAVMVSPGTSLRFEREGVRTRYDEDDEAEGRGRRQHRHHHASSSNKISNKSSSSSEGGDDGSGGDGHNSREHGSSDGSSDAGGPPQLCCVDCTIRHERELQGHMECLVVRFGEEDLRAVVKEITRKVEGLEPVPVEEYYGLL
ncbi:hypothetical protein PTSG_09058 [Salpingoeca rosetta]|uniref:Uncharacterized protein n=1 Tax=Salpingoeca rosetta (strain ATCC 50818 / BSB-021) TaxID=946362 RepID=F2UM33_SALR5|nr:uncharacterized protein PTSG_09058 [Salpingoeca rosetta]EGD78182.1 hypothetical protein PTSG_09058 [Salpingoeca rosetta]|eukprot:XP_004989858.1 hypothetical protein PTSG_09058 [Salpingoeca rosetta]